MTIPSIGSPHFWGSLVLIFSNIIHSFSFYLVQKIPLQIAMTILQLSWLSLLSTFANLHASVEFSKWAASTKLIFNTSSINCELSPFEGNTPLSVTVPSALLTTSKISSKIVLLYSSVTTWVSLWKPKLTSWQKQTSLHSLLSFFKFPLCIAALVQQECWTYLPCLHWEGIIIKSAHHS